MQPRRENWKSEFNGNKWCWDEIQNLEHSLWLVDRFSAQYQLLVLCSVQVLFLITHGGGLE